MQTTQYFKKLKGPFMILSANYVLEREAAELGCWKDYYDYCPKRKAKLLGLEHRKIGPVHCFAMPAHDILAFNRTVYPGQEQLTESVLKEVSMFYLRLGIKRWMIQFPSLVDRSLLTPVLTSCGYSFHNRWVKLEKRATVPLHPLSHGLTVQEASSKDREVVAAIISCSFGFPFEVGCVLSAPLGKKDWRFYMAMRGKEPISTSSLHLHHKIATLGVAATPSYARGLKAQQAQIIQRMNDARNFGSHFVNVETGEDLPEKPNYSFRNMIRQNMEVVYHKYNYVVGC